MFGNDSNGRPKAMPIKSASLLSKLANLDSTSLLLKRWSTSEGVGDRPLATPADLGGDCRTDSMPLRHFQ